jgi:hypothetical protein
MPAPSIMFDSPWRLPLASRCGKFAVVRDRESAAAGAALVDSRGCRKTMIRMEFSIGRAAGRIAGRATPVLESSRPVPRSLREILETMT